MSDRSAFRFIQKEQMKAAGLEKICKPNRWDGINERYRSSFAMHWRNFPDMGTVPIIPKHRMKHTKRNLNIKRRAMA